LAKSAKESTVSPGVPTQFQTSVKRGQVAVDLVGELHIAGFMMGSEAVVRNVRSDDVNLKSTPFCLSTASENLPSTASWMSRSRRRGTP